MKLKALTSIIFLCSCVDPVRIPQPPEESLKAYTLKINLSKEYQSIHSFGASDAWTGKFVGKWGDIAKRNKIADLLFSTDTLANGTPVGIGLSLWRFNIGAGSFEQGVSSNISDEWRREECFQNANGTYNWNKHEGQRWLLEAARARGVKYTMGFSISPPVHMTKNGKAFSPGGNRLNIQDGKLDDFADFLVEVSSQMEFDYLSPLNEPQWGWNADGSGFASQEGTPALNTDVASLTKLLSEKAAARGVNTKIVVAEAAQLNFLYGPNNDNDGRGYQITDFFSPASPNYIGNLPGVQKILSGHSYFTTCPEDNLVNIRTSLKNKMNEVDPSLQFWQTEFGILGSICGKLNGYPRNTGIDYGLYVASVIHHDLAIGNASSWQWWLSISPYDYSDALVYINAPNGTINVSSSKDDGQVLDSKQLWAFGHYSRFVRPNMKRVDASLSGLEDPVKAASSLMVSAYKDEQRKEIVIVAVNVSESNLELSLSDLPIAGKYVNVYTTNNAKSLSKSRVLKEKISIGAKSITTITAKYL